MDQVRSDPDAAKPEDDVEKQTEPDNDIFVDDGGSHKSDDKENVQKVEDKEG